VLLGQAVITLSEQLLELIQQQGVVAAFSTVGPFVGTLSPNWHFPKLSTRSKLRVSASCDLPPPKKTKYQKQKKQKNPLSPTR
jgi:hypothetical protein